MQGNIRLDNQAEAFLIGILYKKAGLMMGSRMYQYEKIPRTPLEGSASDQSSATLAFGDFTCTNVKVLSEDGASGIVYKAESEDFYHSEGMPSASLIVKECYPVEIAEKLVRTEGALSLSSDADEDDALCFDRFLKQFKDSFSSHAALYQSSAREQIVVPDKSFSLNGTEYLVSDASNGDTMTIAFENMDLADKIRALIRVSEAIAAIHEAGYVYLDLKPDNILCIRNSDASSSALYTGEIKLFDFDTATKITDLSNTDTLISGSGCWSAHEQTHQGYRDKIGPQSDIYSIGALLFWVAVGRPPKSNEVIHADGRWSISSRDCANAEFDGAGERGLQCLRRILNSTLTVDPALRYPTTKPLIDDLVVLGDLVLPVGPTHASDHLAVMEKLDALASLVSQQMGGGAVRAEKPNGTKQRREGAAQSPTEVSEKDYDPGIPSNFGQTETSSNQENPAVAGFAVYKMLNMLANDFKRKDLQDEVRAVLSSTAAEVKEVLTSRSAANAEELLETATEMANSATKLLVCNMTLAMSDKLDIPEEGTRVCETAISALSHAIAEKDVDEMFWRGAEAELCIKAITPLAAAQALKKQGGKYLSNAYLANVDDAIDGVILAMKDADAEKLDAAIAIMEEVLSRAEDDAVAGAIAMRLNDQL